MGIFSAEMAEDESNTCGHGWWWVGVECWSWSGTFCLHATISDECLLIVCAMMFCSEVTREDFKVRHMPSLCISLILCAL